MKNYFIRMFCWIFILWQILFSQPKKTIAVIELNPAGLSKVEAQILSDRLRTELFNTGVFTVLEREKMEEILTEQGFQQTGCATNECAIEVGKLIGVEQMVAGNVGKLADMYTINLRLIDVETGKVLQTATQDCQCPITTVLTQSIKNVADHLSGKKGVPAQISVNNREESMSTAGIINMDKDIRFAQGLFITGNTERSIEMLNDIISESSDHSKIVQAINLKINLIDSSEADIRNELIEQYIYSKHRKYSNLQKRYLHQYDKNISRKVDSGDLNELIEVIEDSDDGNISYMTYKVMINMAKFYLKLEADEVAFEALNYVTQNCEDNILVQNALFLKIKFGTENIEEDFYKLKFYYPNSTLIPEAEKIINSKK